MEICGSIFRFPSLMVLPCNSGASIARRSLREHEMKLPVSRCRCFHHHYPAWWCAREETNRVQVVLLEGSSGVRQQRRAFCVK